jgi:heme-degrading monooxygenase HmoA
VFALVFRYRVDPDETGDFEQVYGPDGPWARLFARAEGYAGTELLADAGRAGSYLVIDRWASRAARAAFLAAHGEEYDAFGLECEHLWLDEQRLGAFEGR